MNITHLKPHDEDLIIEEKPFELNFDLIHSSSPSHFQQYKKTVLSIPDMTLEQEIESMKLFIEKNDIQSVQKVIVANLKHVLYIVKKYKGYGLPEEDLVQEGNIGLMKAVKNYDLSFHVKIITYAISWIKAEIQTYILKNWKIVKIATTNELKKLFFSLRETQKEGELMGFSFIDLKEMIAKKLNVSKENVLEMMNYFYQSDCYLDDDENYTQSLIDYHDPEYHLSNQQQNILLQQLNLLIHQGDILTEKEKSVMVDKYLMHEHVVTNKEIAQKLGISAERVRQLEESAIKKIKKNFNVH